jgi:hypothetical protein
LKRLLLDQAMQPRPPKQPIHRLLDDALLCTHQHNKSITKQHDRNIVLDIPFDIDRGKREGTTTNLEKNNLRAARTCRGRRPEETKSSGGGTWYRSSSTGRTTLRQPPLPGARAAAATAAAAPAPPRCSLTDATLPFPALAPKCGLAVVLLAFFGAAAAGGLRGGGEYLNQTSLQASGSGEHHHSDSGALAAPP